jgi:hypothetical protein
LYIQIFDFFQHKSNIFSSSYIMIYRPSHHSRAESWLILINSIGPLVFYPLVIIIQKRNNLVLSIIKFYNPPPPPVIYIKLSFRPVDLLLREAQAYLLDL